MHRWGQSQMFRSLAFYLAEARRATDNKRHADNAMDQQFLPLASQPV
jgi:hypothetical protein